MNATTNTTFFARTTETAARAWDCFAIRILMLGLPLGWGAFALLECAREALNS